MAQVLVPVDDTLTRTGYAADAKATGDALAGVNRGMDAAIAGLTLDGKAPDDGNFVLYGVDVPVSGTDERTVSAAIQAAGARTAADIEYDEIQTVEDKIGEIESTGLILGDLPNMTWAQLEGGM